MIVVIIPVEPAIQRVHLLVPAGFTGAVATTATPTTASPVAGAGTLLTIATATWGFVFARPVFEPLDSLALLPLDLKSDSEKVFEIEKNWRPRRRSLNPFPRPKAGK